MNAWPCGASEFPVFQSIIEILHAYSKLNLLHSSLQCLLPQSRPYPEYLSVFISASLHLSSNCGPLFFFITLEHSFKVCFVQGLHTLVLCVEIKIIQLGHLLCCFANVQLNNNSFEISWSKDCVSLQFGARRQTKSLCIHRHINMHTVMKYKYIPDYTLDR